MGIPVEMIRDGKNVKLVNPDSANHGDYCDVPNEDGQGTTRYYVTTPETVFDDVLENAFETGWSHICTTKITSMSSLFNDGTRRSYLDNIMIGDFDTSKVTSMHYMFHGCSLFNQPVNFDTNKVAYMHYMFQGCSSFNQPVNFDTSKVVNMFYMFQGCSSFNQPVNFDTSKVTYMHYMFQGCSLFNQPVNFDTNKVTSMYAMFSGCSLFNQPVNFDTNKVANMYFMFYSCSSFNQPVNFDTNKVTSMYAMFTKCTSFNQPVNFDTSNVANMGSMFFGCYAFNQDLSALSVSLMGTKPDHFDDDATIVNPIWGTSPNAHVSFYSDEKKSGTLNIYSNIERTNLVDTVTIDSNGFGQTYLPAGNGKYYYGERKTIIPKVLKATKDKVTDANDYALYINSNSAMLNQTGVPAKVGDTVSKIHSISNELIISQTDETKQPTLQADGSLLFASGDEMLFKDKDGNSVSITGTVKINGIEKTLIDSSKIQYGDLDNGILISLIKE